MTIIIYTGSFNYIAAISWSLEQNLISLGGSHPLTGKDDPTISSDDRIKVLAGWKINLKGGGNHPLSVDES